jgi:hypothetical protein
MRSATSENVAVYTLRIERSQLERLRVIADHEHRTLVQKLRVMIEREIALADASVTT